MSTLIHLTLARPTQNQHCQTSTGWNVVKVDGKTMAEAAAAWYFDGSEEKHVDAPFPGNPTCGQSHGRRVLCWLFWLLAAACLLFPAALVAVCVGCCLSSSRRL